ncbi:MAG: NADH-quinone oxidoreductase subunit NuoI [Chloroflexi bacterium]|nr:NADH-quinone oxidoreductase subunit NuoI [Chloroflexota bacterium]
MINQLLVETAAIVRGLATTLKHIFRPPITEQYPEQKRPMFPRFRGRHHLLRHENGLERCIGCSLCAGVCPAGAIFVEAAENTPEHRVSPGERYAKVYEINMIRCIFCGYCEEVCPTEAIVLGHEYELADFDRTRFVYTKEMLLSAVGGRRSAVGSQGSAVGGPVGSQVSARGPLAAATGVVDDRMGEAGTPRTADPEEGRWP